MALNPMQIAAAIGARLDDADLQARAAAIRDRLSRPSEPLGLARGMYFCAGCLAPLFRYETKYASGCGWPSFYDDLGGGVVEVRVDRSHGMIREEIVCATCGGHLGHVFPDGPPPTGRRYCVNSASVELIPD
jgi:methionine-R-sulfoxide reductase